MEPSRPVGLVNIERISEVSETFFASIITDYDHIIICAGGCKGHYERLGGQQEVGIPAQLVQQRQASAHRVERTAKTCPFLLVVHFG
jgi:hypothetical protein